MGEAKENIMYGNMESNLEFLFDNNLINKHDKILEIGSGKGTFLNYLLSLGYDVQGIEPYAQFHERAKSLYGEDFPLYLTSRLTRFEDSSFDVVLSFDVLEHIPNTNIHLREVRRVLKPGGLYCLATPNKFTNVPWEIVKNKNFTSYKKYHCSLYSLQGLRKILLRNGFMPFFYNQKINTNFFKTKVKRVFGALGLLIIKAYNPDRLPMFLKPTIYAKCKRLE